MEIEAVRDPAAEGVNVTLILQGDPGATLLPQLLVWAKSVAFVPLIVMLDMLKRALPSLPSSTLNGMLVVPVFCDANVRLVVERETVGAGDGDGLTPTPPPPPPQAPAITAMRSVVANSQPAARRPAMPHVSTIAKARSAARSQGHTTSRGTPGGGRRGRVGCVALLAAVVLMEKVVATGEEPVSVTDDGVIVQVVPVGHTLFTYMFTVPLNPLRGVSVRVELPDCPGAGIVMVVGFADTLKSVTSIVIAGEVEPA